MTAAENLHATKVRPGVDWRLIAVIGLIVAVLVSLRMPDMDSENIGSWFHAKLFLKDFSFIEIARSPLYQMYLVPFSFLPHPASIISEKIVTTFLCFLPVAGLMWAYFGRGIGLAAAVLAAPDLFQILPTPQALAFAAICLALFVRRQQPFLRVSTISTAYTLLLVAWLLRSNTVIVLGVFVVYDLCRIYAGRLWQGTPRKIQAGRHWPLLAALAVFMVMALNPSSHRWNNYQQIEQTWQPVHGQMDTVLSYMAAIHFRNRDPKTGGQPFDLYYTHKRFFGDAENFPSMVLTNPGELIRHIGRNVGAFLTTSVSMTQAGQFLLRFTGLGQKKGRGGALDHRYVAVGASGVLGAMFLYMIWGLWRDPARRELAVLAFGLATATGVAGLLTIGSSQRVLYFAYGLFMIMAAFYAEQLFAWANRARPRRMIPAITAGTALFLLTQGGWAKAGQAGTALGWARIAHNISDIPAFGLRPAFYKGLNPDLFAVINRQWPRCRGLMTAEMPQLIGAFTDIPEERLFSPFEIPPFGVFGDSDYSGLRKDRVNCLYVPKSVMAAGIDSPTNIRLRYRSYIKPYMRKLLLEGGRKIELPAGTLIVEVEQ